LETAGGQLIETDVIEAVLTAGIEGGGEFAEIFVEDRRSTSALLDDGRVGEPASAWWPATPPGSPTPQT
jgi:hypothetical protein